MTDYRQQKLNNIFVLCSLFFTLKINQMRRLFLLILLILPFKLWAQIERVEPMFWWVGMKNPQLQLLVHADKISDYNVSTNYPGVKITKTEKADSPNYLFITLNIQASKAKPGSFDIVFHKPGSENLLFRYELKSREKSSSARIGFNSSDVVYLLMPDRFANGNTANDSMDEMPEKANRNIDYGRHGGDIQGIIDHLDYIKELGATVIWPTPLLENNYPRYSYHGYAISDIYKIDPRFGTNEDYQKLVNLAHEKGLKVIMDMVSNHGGINAWWMKDLPSADWIHNWSEMTYTNHKAWTMKDIHASDIDKKLFLDGWFDKTMPDMNQQNPFFLTWFIQNSIWWVEYAGIDGIRMDTYPYNDKDGMAKWAQAIMTEYPKFNIVGETWLFSPQDIAFWQKDAVNPQKYNSQMPSVMDFILQKALTTCFNEHGKPWEDLGMNRLYSCIAGDYAYADLNNLLVFAENHDTQRFHKNYDGDLEKYKMAMTFIMTTRGIPQIYYGTEIGITGDKNKGDGDIRRDFPGGWKDDSQNAFIAEERTPEQKKYFDFLSELLHWRQKKEVIHTGKLIHYVPENDVYVYFRYNENERIMVILNNNETPQTIQLKRYHQMLNGYKSGVDPLSGKTYDLLEKLEIPAQTALILELKAD